MGSYDRILTATFRLSLRKKHAKPGRINFDWDHLKITTIADSYTVSVKNRYEALSAIGESITDAYENLTKAVKFANEEHLPIKKRDKKS